MPIATSQIIEDHAQADGRRHVRERHTDQLGGVHEVAYMAEVGANTSTIMAARVASLDAQLQSSELAANVSEALGEDL